MSSAWGLSWGKAWGNSWGLLTPTPPTPPDKPLGMGPGWRTIKRKPGKKYIFKLYGKQFEIEEVDDPDAFIEEHKEYLESKFKRVSTPPVVEVVVRPDTPRIDYDKIIRQLSAALYPMFEQAIRERDDEDAIALLL